MIINGDKLNKRAKSTFNRQLFVNTLLVQIIWIVVVTVKMNTTTKDILFCIAILYGFISPIMICLERVLIEIIKENIRKVHL
jgi:hypothetical protein